MIGGCGDGTATSVVNESASAGASNAAPAMPAVRGEGIIRGKIIFTGSKPKEIKIDNSQCTGHAKPIIDETIVVNDNGTLRNVFVYLEGAGEAPFAGGKDVLIDQVDCQYVPHVIGVQVGQTVRVRSSDDTLHNVHTLCEKNASDNLPMTRAGAEKKLKFKSAEFIHAKCDVHPWMSAYIGVFDNPFFAISGGDGTFEINGIPDGQYTLVAWHEHYGQQKQEVTVAKAAPAESEFTFRSE
ncbi:MAG TPA: hypothetical protein VIL86_10280 [Tepidisphaeraceae bacterium]